MLMQTPEFPHYWTESNPLVSYFPYGIIRCLEDQLMTDIDHSTLEFTDLSYLIRALDRPVDSAIWGCMFDFCIASLKCNHDRKKWKILREWIQCSGIFLRFEKVCIVCEPPCLLSFDKNNELHADDKPALQFADGYSVYACHGQHSSPF
jgi:hypothetical protein